MAPRAWMISILGLLIGLTLSTQTVIGQEQDLQGSGTMVIPKAISGYDEKKVKEDPICDPTNRPHITSVEPDVLSPGDQVTIKGKYFGEQKCLHGVTFGSTKAEKVTTVDSNTLQVTVPEAKPGMTFITIETGGGSARSAVLLKSKG